MKFPGGTPNLDKNRLYLIWLFQTAVWGGGLAFCLRFGASPSFWITGVGLYVVQCIVLGWFLWANAITPNPLPAESKLLWFMVGGIGLTSLILIGAAVAVLMRTNSKCPIGVYALCGFLLLLSILTFVLSWKALRHGTTPWFQFAIGLTLIPLLVSWIVASITAGAFQRGLIRGEIQEANALKNELERRGRWEKDLVWKMKDEERSPVFAVALSGGGYRAASIHAGFLQALDEKCVPIHYLATTSGGAIIGAYYALGHKPEEFYKKLMKGRPGFPDEFLNIQAVMLDLFWPGWTSADTYAEHFDHAFFKGKALKDTGAAPRLLIGATDIEQSAVLALEVFFKDRAPGQSRQNQETNARLNDTKLADAVAAAAAVPGAFQPKGLSWLPAAGDGDIMPRRFVDGGVVDNLGYQALVRSLLYQPNASSIDLLLISDAGLESTAGKLPIKVGPLQLILESQEIAFDVHHQLLRDSINPDRSKVIRTTSREVAEILAKHAFKGEPGDLVALEVHTFETLRELNKEEVEKAFWVGHTLGLHHVDTNLATRFAFMSEPCKAIPENENRSSAVPSRSAEQSGIR